MQAAAAQKAADASRSGVEAAVDAREQAVDVNCEREEERVECRDQDGNEAERARNKTR